MLEGFRARAALAVLLPATMGWLAVVPVPAAHAQEPEMNVQLESITPVVTGGTDQVTATGQVRNTGKVPLQQVKVSLWISESPLTSRKAIGQVASGDSSSLSVIPGSRLAYPETLVVDITDELQPGERDDFEVRIDVADLIGFGVDSPGTYVAGVDVRGDAERTGVRHTWSERVFMPWVRDGEESRNVDLTPVEVTYLLPLTAPSRLADDQTLLDGGGKRPGELFAPDGRLDRLLDIGAEYGLSYLVDPALLELAGITQQGYRWSSDDPDREPNRRAGATPAGVFLDKARGLLASSDALMLPYGDPDLPALQRHGLADRYSAAIEQAHAAAEEFDTSRTELSWPGNGFATDELLSTVTESGGSTVLLRTSAVPDRQSDTEPVVSLSTDEGSLTGLVSDPSLLGGGPGSGESGLQRRQRLLAETSLVAMRDGPSDESRRMVTTLPRDWDGAGADELFGAITDGEFPWLRQLSASALLSDRPTVYGGELVYPSGQREQELGGDLMTQLKQLDREADRYLGLLAEPRVQRGTVDREFLRAASMAWRPEPRKGNRLASEMTDVLTSANDAGVTIIAPRTVTLSENQGRFPVTVGNNLDETIAVDVDVHARGRSGLELEQVEPVEVPRWRKATAGVLARAEEPGTYLVRAQLRTAEGDPVGRSVDFQVRVTGFGQVGWGIIGAGIGLLVIAMGYRLVKRTRSRHGSDAASKVADTAPSTSPNPSPGETSPNPSPGETSGETPGETKARPNDPLAERPVDQTGVRPARDQNDDESGESSLPPGKRTEE